LAAETLEAAFVGVRTREVRRVKQRVEPLLIHQRDEDAAERIAAGGERAHRFAKLLAGWNRRQRGLEPARAVGRKFPRRDEVVERQHLLSRLRAAREIRDPRRLERA